MPDAEKLSQMNAGIIAGTAENNNTGYSIELDAFAGALMDPDVDIPAQIGKNGRSTSKRFAVYRNNVVVSLMEALGAAYPSIAMILGKENFDKVARNYIVHHPPSSPMMQQFGKHFPEFLSGFRPLQNAPFLVDVAIAEIAWLEAIHAKDESVLTPQELGGVDPEKTLALTFEPLRATRLVRSQYPVHTLFEARNTWPVPGINLDESQTLLITRPYLDCIATPLDETRAAFIYDLVSGTSLGEAIGNALEADEAFDAPGSIAMMLETGAFRSLNQSGAITTPTNNLKI